MVFLSDKKSRFVVLLAVVTAILAFVTAARASHNDKRLGSGSVDIRYSNDEWEGYDPDGHNGATETPIYKGRNRRRRSTPLLNSEGKSHKRVDRGRSDKVKGIAHETDFHEDTPSEDEHLIFPIDDLDEWEDVKPSYNDDPLPMYPAYRLDVPHSDSKSEKERVADYNSMFKPKTVLSDEELTAMVTHPKVKKAVSESVVRSYTPFPRPKARSVDVKLGPQYFDQRTPSLDQSASLLSHTFRNSAGTYRINSIPDDEFIDDVTTYTEPEWNFKTGISRGWDDSVPASLLVERKPYQKRDSSIQDFRSMGFVSSDSVNAEETDSSKKQIIAKENDGMVSILSQKAEYQLDSQSDYKADYTASKRHVTMDPEVIVPWQKYMVRTGGLLGFSVDALRGSPALSPVNPINVTKTVGKVSHQHYAVAATQTEAQRLISPKTGFRFFSIAKSVGVSAEAESEKATKDSNHRIYVVATYTSTSSEFDTTSAEIVSTDAAKKMATEDPEHFREVYGDYVAVGGRRAATFSAIVECVASDSKTIRSFDSVLKMSMPAIFNVDGGAEFKNLAKKFDVKIDAHIVMDGYRGSAPAMPQGLDGVLESLEWFKHHESPRYVEVQLRHVSLLPGLENVPRKVAVDPAVVIAAQDAYDEAEYLTARAKKLEEIGEVNGPELTHIKHLVLRRYSEATTSDKASVQRLIKANKKLLNAVESLEASAALVGSKNCVGGQLAVGVFVGPEGTGRRTEWLCGTTRTHRKYKTYERKVKGDKSGPGAAAWREFEVEFVDPDAMVVGVSVSSRTGLRGEWVVADTSCVLTNECRLRVYAVPNSELVVQIVYALDAQ